MLIKSNTALLRLQSLSKSAQHNQTTSLQVVPDAGDLVTERLTHFLSQTTHLLCHVLAFFLFPITITGNIRVLMASISCIKDLLWIYFSQLWSSKHSKNHRNGELAAEGPQRLFQEFIESIRTPPDTQSTKYWLFQILCLSLVLGWQSKQLDCHSTVFHPVKPSSAPTPRPACLLVHLQYCFLHVGGPKHFKVPSVGAPVGWETAIAQLSRIALVNAKETHAGYWVWAISGLDSLREWESQNKGYS